MGNFFDDGSMTMKLHILKVIYGLEPHAKDGRCRLSRNEDIRQCVGKLVEKQTVLMCVRVRASVLCVCMCEGVDIEWAIFALLYEYLHIPQSEPNQYQLLWVAANHDYVTVDQILTISKFVLVLYLLP